MKNIDVQSLLEEARISEYNESYRTLEKNEDIRIGVGARTTPTETPTLFLEVAISLNPGESVNLDSLDQKISLLKDLKARDYVLSCQDESIICCEIPTTERSIIEDTKHLVYSLKTIHTKRRKEK